MLRSFIFHLRYFYHKKLRQTHRISHKTLEFVCLLIGATFVALFSFGFAKLADIGLEFNAYWSAKYPLAVWIVLPLGLAFSPGLPPNTHLMLAAAVFTSDRLHQYSL